MPPAALTLCMYARTVSRSTDESIGPVMSKKPPMTILPPAGAPPVDPPADPVGPVDPVVEEPVPCVEAIGPLEAPVPESANEDDDGCVRDRTVITPRMQAMTTEAVVRATATRARVSRVTTGQSSRW
jgi:hypothetical protein